MKTTLIAGAAIVTLAFATQANAEGCAYAKPQNTAQMSKPESTAQMSTPADAEKIAAANSASEPTGKVAPVETASATSVEVTVKPN